MVGEMVCEKHFGNIKNIQFKLRFLIIMALLIDTNCVLLSEKCQNMIKEAIDSFEKEAANSGPVVVISSLPTVTEEWLSDPEGYIGLPFILLHPLAQFPLLFKQSPLLCPICQKDGLRSALTSTNIWRDGRSARSARQPRLIYGIDCPVLLVSKVYKCNNGHNEIPANDPDIIKRIPQSFLPFMLTHQSGLTTELLLFVEDLIDSGISINAIESTIHNAYKRHLSLREERFWIDSRLAKSFNKAVDINCPFPACQHYPSSHFITNAVVSHFQLNEAFYCDYFSSLGARWLSCDHTFKSAMKIGYFRHSDNKWINQYRSLFCILNEFGQVIQWQLTASEGFDEVRPMFIDLKNRLDKKDIVPEGVFIDNCCKWREAINSVFPKIPVKLDLFHAVQRIVKKIPKRKKLNKDMANDIGLLFRATNDYGETRKCNTPKPADIIENFKKFEKKWKNPKYKNGTNILSKEIRKEIKNLLVHVEKGCLSGIPPSCSTSRNERLHKDLNKFVRSSSLGVELAYTRIFRTLYLHNKKKDLSTKTTYESRASVAKEAYQTAVDTNSDFANISPVERTNVEIFGIRPKMQDGQVNKGSFPNKGKKIDEFNYNLLMDIRSSLQSAMRMMGEENEEKTPEYILFDILSQALGWWAIALTLESFMGKRVVDKRKVQSVAKARLNTSTIGLSKLLSSPKKTWDSESQRLHEMAGMWGFSIVDIPKNGNCLFTAVGFQLLQLFSTVQVPVATKVHLENLGINSELNLEEIAAVLRNLVVDEWLGPDMEDYLDFFRVDSKEKFIQHAKTYRLSGTYASELGDAMPLALANILGMPLVILSTETFTPFLDICPREVKSDVFPIYLCYYTTGGGHYDALIRSQNDEDSQLSSSPESAMAIGDVQPSPIRSVRTCRCGANEKRKKTPSRKYSARCPCIKSGLCSPSCKCSGQCGSFKCRSLPESKEEKSEIQRKSRKRGSHCLQHKMQKNANAFMIKKKEKIEKGNLNDAEFYLLHTIINYAQNSPQKSASAVNMQNIYQFYIDVAKMVEQSPNLYILPIRQWDKIALNKEIVKMVKDDENFDSFADI